MSPAAVIRLGVVAAALGALELACRTGVIPSLTAIPPSAMAAGLARILQSGKFTPDIVTTLRNVAAAIVAAICSRLEPFSI